MTWAISMTCYLSELIDRLGGTKKSRLGEKFALKSRYLIGRRSDPKRIKSRLSVGRWDKYFYFKQRWTILHQVINLFKCEVSLRSRRVLRTQKEVSHRYMTFVYLETWFWRGPRSAPEREFLIGFNTVTTAVPLLVAKKFPQDTFR